MTVPADPLAFLSELWRYPVKSMAGERVDSLHVVPDGIEQDRRYAFLSSGAPLGKPRLTSQERAALLRYTAVVRGGAVTVLTPGSQSFHVEDPALLTHLETHLPHGHRMSLEHASEAPPYTDVRPVAIASTQAFHAVAHTYGAPVDPRRFRVNLVLTVGSEAAARNTSAATPLAFPEDALSGQVLQIGSTCRLRILERIPRCRIVTLDPYTVEPDPGLMKHLDRQYEGRLGIYAAVVTPGTIRVGDPVHEAAAIG